MTVGSGAICSLFRRFTHDCKRLAATEREMKKLMPAYLRYRDLLEEQNQLRTRIIKTFGVLGVHSPDVSKETAKLISPTREITSLDVRRGLKLWEVLELFLSAVDGGASVGDFRAFLFQLGWQMPTPQAIDSAIKAHPDIFHEQSAGRDKVLTLRS